LVSELRNGTHVSCSLTALSLTALTSSGIPNPLPHRPGRSGLMNLTRLVYASESRLVEANRRQELSRIIASAQRLNRENAITGYLLVTPGAFAQVLEGARHDIAETYGRIVLDPRHVNLRLLSEEPVARRHFGEWSMGLAERDETTAFIFDLHGVTPEADLQTQSVEALLDLAGELARHAP